MSKDLKIIKKKYGEKMMHLCRELFPTILEYPGVLSTIFLNNFEPSKALYDSLMQMEENEAFERGETREQFKDYIYSFFKPQNITDENGIEKSSQELMSEAGYILYECKTEEEIQYFKRYYAKGEELCTFSTERLNRCIVFFAVKKDVERIKRENFPNPQRQDEYGTSVISIQFTKDESHTLSIKNRYNHTVLNPDATFSNNLNRIIPGLEKAFEIQYGLKQKYGGNKIEIYNHVRASDGRYYPYYKEINNIYYCYNNIIIDNFEVKRYPKEKYLLFEHFILDLSNGQVTTYDDKLSDSFAKSIKGMGRAQIIKKGKDKEILIPTYNDQYVVITINENGRLLSVKNPTVTEVGDDFLCDMPYLYHVEMEKLRKTGKKFLAKTGIARIEFPMLVIAGDDFCCDNKIDFINLPKCKKCGDNFIRYNDSYIEILNMPSVEFVGNYFCSNQRGMNVTEINMKKLRVAGDGFFKNTSIGDFNYPMLEIVGDDFCENASMLKLPKLKKTGKSFLKNYGAGRSVKDAKRWIHLESLESVGEDSFMCNKKLLKAILKENGIIESQTNYLFKDIIKLLNAKLQHIDFFNRGEENEKTNSTQTR